MTAFKTLYYTLCVLTFATSSFFEFLYLMDRKKGVLKPKNRIHKVALVVLTVALPAICSIISLPVIKGLLKYDWQIIPIMVIIMICFNTLGRSSVLIIWYIVSGFKNRPILANRIQFFLVIITSSIFISYTLLQISFLDLYWVSYNELEQKTLLLFILFFLVIPIDYVVTLLREIIFVFKFVNGNIDPIGILLPGLDLILSEKYNYDINWDKGIIRLDALVKSCNNRIENKQKEENLKKNQDKKLKEFAEMILR